jgi:DNA-binding NarL/FixJ family response regulator
MKKILVIEDQPQMRRNLLLILQREGFDAAGAVNGREGVQMAMADPPDLILCDIMMPELDGYGVLDALRADAVTSDVPFIFLTAKGQRVDQRAGMDYGADDYLTKPLMREELLNAINARLKRQELQEQRQREKIAAMKFQPNFTSPVPLESAGITPREAEVLFWVAQGKANGDVAGILNVSVLTVKKHLQNIFQKLGVENRHCAAVRALEILSAGQLR